MSKIPEKYCNFEPIPLFELAPILDPESVILSPLQILTKTGIITAPYVLYITADFKVPRGAQHGCRVYLAHVGRLIAGLDALDVEVPLLPFRLRHGEAGIARDHQLVHGEDRLRVYADPSYLKMIFSRHHSFIVATTTTYEAKQLACSFTLYSLGSAFSTWHTR